MKKNKLDDVYPLMLLSKANKDTMYLHEAMEAPDRAEFIKAMQAQIGSHTDQEQWKLMQQSDIPEKYSIINAIQ
jgi:DNA-binding phage protein